MQRNTDQKKKHISLGTNHWGKTNTQNIDDQNKSSPAIRSNKISRDHWEGHGLSHLQTPIQVHMIGHDYEAQIGQNTSALSLSRKRAGTKSQSKGGGLACPISKQRASHKGGGKCKKRGDVKGTG